MCSRCVVVLGLVCADWNTGVVAYLVQQSVLCLSLVGALAQRDRQTVDTDNRA